MITDVTFFIHILQEDNSKEKSESPPIINDEIAPPVSIDVPKHSDNEYVDIEEIDDNQSQKCKCNQLSETLTNCYSNRHFCHCFYSFPFTFIRLK